MKKNNKYEVSSGNIFADLKLSHPHERLTKADLAYQINTLIQEKGLTQTAAAQLLDIDQPKISALNTGNLSGFSIERLFRYLNILGQDIIIKISPKRQTTKKSAIIVTAPRMRPFPKNNSSAAISKTASARKKASKQTKKK